MRFALLLLLAVFCGTLASLALLQDVALDTLGLVKAGAAALLTSALVGAVVIPWDRRLRLGARRAVQALDSSNDGYWVLDAEGRFVEVNEAYGRMVGRPRAEVMRMKIADFEETATQDGIRAQIQRILKAGHERFETRHRHRDGHWIYLEITVTAVNHGLLVAFLRDVSRRKAAEERINRLAFYDPLTALPNRRLLRDRLDRALLSSSRSAQHGALLFIDLDNFKLLNDTRGHSVGDELLVQVAMRLSRCVRSADTVARQGGDEFVVVLPEMNGETDAARVARKLLDNLFQPLLLCGQEVFPTGSIGIAMYPRDGTDSATLLKCADSAMYGSKGEGGNGFSFYMADMGAQTALHLRMESELQRALQRREFVLHYQPVVDIATGHLGGVEALLRWQPQGKPMVSPADFIPLAEETGLIVPIGEWVLETAMAQQVAWQQGGLPPVRVSVNLSARQFLGQDVAQRVAVLLEKTGCDPRALTLEITESVLMQNPVAATETMARLAAMGVQLAIDDFGTGYSSLASLKRFPIHSLKIDRSFVSDLIDDADDAAIVDAVIGLAHSMKLNVIAEGVETADQLAFLLAHGCDQMQGFCYSRPVAPDAIEALLRAAPAGQGH